MIVTEQAPISTTTTARRDGDSKPGERTVATDFRRSLHPRTATG